MMFVIIDDESGQVTGYLFASPAPAPDEIDALASRITFGRDSAATREARELAAWEDELATWLDDTLDPADPIRDVLWPED